MSDRPMLYCACAGPKGRGVFAAAPLAAGQRVLVFRGPRLGAAAARDLARSIQVGPDTFLGPSGEIDDYVNHSCSPNCGLREFSDGLGLVALRDVAAGEEITFDYSTCMVEEPELSGCRCGAGRCRGTIRRFEDLPGELQREYLELGVVPPFVANGSCEL